MRIARELKRRTPHSPVTGSLELDEPLNLERANPAGQCGVSDPEHRFEVGRRQENALGLADIGRKQDVPGAVGK